MASRIEYREGGNPPIAAGLFAIDDRTGRSFTTSLVTRLAWWPTGAVEPTSANINLVVTELIWKRDDDKPITREQILELFKDDVRVDMARGAYRRRQ